ncbi:MAG: hypothetical protein R2764_25170 [Bacteroidales bacterium]
MALPNGEVEDYAVFIDEPIPENIDWGDAPDAPYPTHAAANGANHLIDGITYLGNQVDGEPDGQPDGMALGMITISCIHPQMMMKMVCSLPRLTFRDKWQQ